MGEHLKRNFRKPLISLGNSCNCQSQVNKGITQKRHTEYPTQHFVLIYINVHFFTIFEKSKALKNKSLCLVWWLTPVIPPSWKWSRRLTMSSSPAWTTEWEKTKFILLISFLPAPCFFLFCFKGLDIHLMWHWIFNSLVLASRMLRLQVPTP